MGQLKVQYDIKRANKKDGINRIIIPHCVTEKKYDRLDAREKAKAEFDALADDVNTHVSNKVVTVVGCDTLQAANEIIAEFIKYVKIDINHAKDLSQPAPWKTKDKWLEAEEVTRKRGEMWYQFNKDIITKLKGVEEATYKSWEQLDGQDNIIKQAYESDTHEFKTIIDKLATTNANRLLSKDEILSKNRDLFKLCSPEVIELARSYLISESAKIYNWMDKFDTLFYRTEDKDIKTMFASLRKIAEENGVKASLRLIDYRTFDAEKRLEATAKKAQNQIKPIFKTQADGNIYNLFQQKTNSRPSPSCSPPNSPEKKKRKIMLSQAHDILLGEDDVEIIKLYQAAKKNAHPLMVYCSVAGMLNGINGMSQPNSLSSSPDSESTLLNYDSETTDEVSSTSSESNEIDIKNDSNGEGNSLAKYAFSLSH